MKKNLKCVFLLYGIIYAAANFTVPVAAEDFASLKTKNEFTVLKVLRADYIQLSDEQRVRLIGLKGLEPPSAPEVKVDELGFIVKEQKLTRTIEERAFEFAKTLLEGKKIRLEFDEQKRDSSHTLTAYVFIVEDGTFVNGEILRQGYANLSLTPPNLKYAEELRAAYREARTEHRGLHEEY